MHSNDPFARTFLVLAQSFERSNKVKKNPREVITLHYYHPEVKFLLVDHSDEQVEMLYDFNSHTWPMPKIGPRPPYYCNPRYEQYYPVI